MVKNPLKIGDLPYVLLCGLAVPAMRVLNDHGWAAPQGWASQIAAIPRAMDWFFYGIAVAVIAMEPFRASSRTVQAWKSWNRLFVLTVASAQDRSDFPWRQPVASLRFARNAHGAELKIQGCLPGAGDLPILIHFERDLECLKDSCVRVPIYNFAIFDPAQQRAHPSSEVSGHLFSTGELKRVFVEMRAGIRRQRELVDLIVRPTYYAADRPSSRELIKS